MLWLPRRFTGPRPLLRASSLRSAADYFVMCPKLLFVATLLLLEEACSRCRKQGWSELVDSGEGRSVSQLVRSCRRVMGFEILQGHKSIIGDLEKRNKVTAREKSGRSVNYSVSLDSIPSDSQRFDFASIAILLQPKPSAPGHGSGLSSFSCRRWRQQFAKVDAGRAGGIWTQWPSPAWR